MSRGTWMALIGALLIAGGVSAWHVGRARADRGADEEATPAQEQEGAGQVEVTPDQDEETTGVFRPGLPEELENEIQDRMDEIASSARVSEEDTTGMEQRLSEVHLGQAMDDRIRDFFRELGVKCAPFLEESLTVDDVETRQRALIMAGRVLLARYEPTPEEVRWEKEILVPLLLRALYDKSPKMRFGATATLGGIARKHYPSPEPRIVKALEAMLADEDPDVARVAASCLYRSGQTDSLPPDQLELLRKGEQP